MHKTIQIPSDILNKLKHTAVQDTPTKLMAINFLKAPQHILNEYLNSIESRLRAYNCILFHRRAGIDQNIHIDCDNSTPPNAIKCALNIPLENCSDSLMEWYGGEYHTSANSYVGGDGITRSFLRIDDTSSLSVIDQCIITEPTLVTVNKPHRVTASSQDRSLITFRFAGNPDYEDVLKQIQRSAYQ